MTAELTEDEKRLAANAMLFARKGSKQLLQRYTDLDRYPPDANPVSVFMAGSPGAGKTEASIALLKRTDPHGTTIPKVYKANIDRIDNHVPERYTEDDVLNIIGRIGTT